MHLAIIPSLVVTNNPHNRLGPLLRWAVNARLGDEKLFDMTYMLELSGMYEELAAF